MTELTISFHFLIICHENEHEFTFYLKKRSSYTSGPIVIYLRFTVDGQRAETFTGKACELARWNVKAGRAIGTKEDLRVLNAYLDKLQAQAQALHQVMTAGEEIITAETVKNRFIGKAEKARTLVAIFEDHNAKMASFVGQEFEKSTLQRYETCLMHTKDLCNGSINYQTSGSIRSTSLF
ncbi:Phage integrase SAM-like domain-containing protein [Mucilaginibacter pineti]|uniref:Phage integrase SAM-like domain-containing protein n=1 Tax=Mucilaginibacter pineti TaxID=1391627 RepID=A0A1G7NZ91_9SPHI|nr:Arm DNA-binding domain-containing protein [Mucilaginibacter pineti]SDF79177.1 Phage integrase SAM-like domain-containing protein [Mucilaginibacter pineti]